MRFSTLEEFIKLAEEKDLPKPKPRNQDISEIEALYGVTPEATYKYENNLAEVAHPNAAVVGRSYDRLNALIENINERSNIMSNISTKPTHANLTNPKYASEQLMQSLVRIANHLDVTDNDNLRILADDCINQLHKQALGPLAIVGIVGLVAAAGGLLYWKLHANLQNMGFEKNAEQLISELEDIITSGTGPASMRSEYRDELKSQLKNVQDKIKSMLSLYKRFEKVLDDIETPKSAQELTEILKTVKKVSDNNYKPVYEAFKASAINIQPMLQQLSKNFSNEVYKHKQLKDEGMFSKMNDFFGGVFYGGKGLVSDEFDDVRRAIAPFVQSIEQIINAIAEAQSAEKDAVKKLEKTKETLDIYEDKWKKEPEKVNPTEEQGVENLFKELESLEKGFNI